MQKSTNPAKFISAIFIFLGLNSFAQSTDFKPSGKLYGYAFGDYYYKMHADSANRGSSQYSNMPETSNAFEFRRVYLGYDYNISEKFSSELLLAYEGQTTSDNATRTTFLKTADVKWKGIYKGADLVFGLQNTPAFPMLTEKIWGYRSIEKTIYDMRKGAASNDLGIGIRGTIGDSANYGYDLLAANGSGNKIETDIFKKFYGDFWAKFMNKKLVFDLYSDFERTNMTPNFHKYKNTIKFSAFYTTDAITIGAEVYATSLHNYVGFTDTSATPFAHDTTKAMVMGISGFVRGTIIKDKLSFFARYDMYNPDREYNKNYVYSMGASPVTESFITAGLDYTPHKNM